MCKKPYFLISFVLVLGISSAGWAANPIDVNNPSFELAPDGNRVPGHVGYDGVMAWKANADGASGFVGVNVYCPYSGGVTPEWCHRWPGPTETGSGTDVVYSYIAQTGANAYQVLDANTSGDPNAVIAAGRRYTLTFDAILEDPADDGNPIKGSLFYPDDVNYPDDAHMELASETYAVQWTERDLGDCNGESYLDPDNQCPDWNYDLTLEYLAETDSEGIGKTLGVKFTAPTLAQEAYMFVDNVRLDWAYATIAYDPNPADGAELVSKNPQLMWKPGGWVASTAGHEVYFGTDRTAVEDANTNTAGIYQTTRDVNNFTPTGPLVLGKSYYWRIDEVNSAHTTPPPPVGPWKGDVWSFRVEGHAYSPSPTDGETEVVFLALDLEWAAGTEAENHVVYFGTDEQAVADATTSSPEYKTTLTVGTESYPVSGELIAGVTYYWRIDEKSAGGSHIITGDTWSFTAGQFLIVDDFDQYANLDPEMLAVWSNYATNPSDAEIALETGDANVIRSGKSMELIFNNTSTGGSGPGKYFIGSWTDAQDMTELGVGGDWTIGGVKALQLFIMGDPCNIDSIYNGVDYGAAWPWVELEDTSSNVSFVKVDDVNVVLSDSWYEWNIDLAIFDACGVTLSAIDRVAVGVGGVRTGQNKASPDPGYIYIEDIRLYPPRCIPEYAREVGNLTEGDCGIDGFDLEIMGRDWVITDKMAQPSPPEDLGLVRYAFDEGASTFVENDGELGSDFDLTIGDSFEWDVNGNFTGNLVSNPNNTPAWVYDTSRGWCLYFDGEEGQGRPGEGPTALGGDYLLIPPLNLNLDTVTITAWVYPQPTFGGGDEMMGPYTGIVMTRTHYGGWGIDGNTTAGLSYGDDKGYDGSMGYVWNDNAKDTWSFETGITIEPLEWNFLALTIEPSQAVCHRVSQSGTLESATNAIAHDAEEFDFYTGIATDWNGMDRFFKGLMSDVRIYGRTLTIDEIMGLGGMSGQTYVPNTSVANISPKDPDLSPDPNLKDSYDPNNPDIVNFLDYDLLAKNWLEEYLWPAW